MERLHSLKLSRFFQHTRTPNCSQICAVCVHAHHMLVNLYFCVCRKNKKRELLHRQKMSLAPITPTKTPAPLLHRAN